MQQRDVYYKVPGPVSFDKTWQFGPGDVPSPGTGDENFGRIREENMRLKTKVEVTEKYRTGVQKKIEWLSSENARLRSENTRLKKLNQTYCQAEFQKRPSSSSQRGQMTIHIRNR